MPAYQFNFEDYEPGAFVLEKASMEENPLFKRIDSAENRIRSANVFADIAEAFTAVFSGEIKQPEPNDYKDENSEFGLTRSGQKTRERLNAQCEEIIRKVDDPKDLTREQIETLKQYSGQGGLKKGTTLGKEEIGAGRHGKFYEFYTTPEVAEGLWDAAKVNGFTNGHVLEPCCGAGVPRLLWPRPMPPWPPNPQPPTPGCTVALRWRSWARRPMRWLRSSA
jgi:hypothetical protein